MDSEVSKMRTVEATETSFDIIEYIQDEKGARLYEIANELDLANSTVYHHLNTLIKRGYVTREGDVYYAGLEFLHKGGKARDRTRINRVSEQLVSDLADRTGEQVQFIVEENCFGYHIHAAPGEQATSIDTRLGKRIFLHANAAGKAILAHYDKSTAENILDQAGMPALTENTITDRERFFDELMEVRKQGYSQNSEEHVKGYCGIAAPIQIDGTVGGALALGGPAERIEDTENRAALVQDLLESSNELELKAKFE